MIAFLADENFDNRIVQGARRDLPSIDILLAQDTSVAGADDRALLEFATRSGRLILSHDANTLIGFASERILAGVRTCGIIEVHRQARLQIVITDLTYVAHCLMPGEWDNLLIYLPL